MTGNSAFKVIESQRLGNRVVVVGELLEGDVARDMELASDSGASFRVLGVGFAPAESVRKAITLEEITGGAVAAGEILHSRRS